jgi:hypothetical protein
VHPVPLDRFRAALADCDEATLASLIADLRRARGGDPEVRTAPDGTPRVVDGAVCVRPVAGGEVPAAPHRDPDVDEVVLAVDPGTGGTVGGGRGKMVDGDVDEAADVEVVGPAALRRRLLYAVDRETGERLLDTHLDLPATVTEPPSGDGTPRDRSAGVVGRPAAAGLAVAALALLAVGATAAGVAPDPVATAVGLDAVDGTNGDRADGTRTSGGETDATGGSDGTEGTDRDPTARAGATPSPTPTRTAPVDGAGGPDDGTVGAPGGLFGGPGLGATGDPASIDGPEAVGPPAISDPYTVPGVRPTGVSNATLLARAHVRAAAERSYVLRTRTQGAPPPALVGVKDQLDQSPRLADPVWASANGTLWASNGTVYRQRVDGRIGLAGEKAATLWVRYRAFADATQVTRRVYAADPVDGDLDVNLSSTLPLSPTVDRGSVVATSAGRAVRRYLTTTESRAEPTGDGGARVVATGAAPLVATGPDRQRVRAYRAEATIAPSGLVRSLTVRYTLAAGPRERTVLVSLRYGGVGNTSVSPPAWAYGRADPIDGFEVAGVTVAGAGGGAGGGHNTGNDATPPPANRSAGDPR